IGQYRERGCARCSVAARDLGGRVGATDLPPRRRGPLQLRDDGRHRARRERRPKSAPWLGPERPLAQDRRRRERAARGHLLPLRREDVVEQTHFPGSVAAYSTRLISGPSRFGNTFFTRRAPPTPS